MKFMVTMFNRVNMSSDSEVIDAIDKNDAVEKFIKSKDPIICSGDRFEAEPYWERDVFPDLGDSTKFKVTMYNEENIDIDDAVIEATDENDAVQKYLELRQPVVYSGDRFEAEPYLETVIQPDFTKTEDFGKPSSEPKLTDPEK